MHDLSHLHIPHNIGEKAHFYFFINFPSVGPATAAASI